MSLIKNDLDTIYGYDVKITNDDFMYYHNNNYNYTFYSKNKTYISNNKRDKNLVSYFLPLNRITEKDFLDSLNILTENEKDLIFIKKYNNEQGFSDIKEKFVISKKSKNLISRTLLVDFQNTNQYSEILFENIKFDTKIDIKKELDSLKTFYQPYLKTEKVLKELKIFVVKLLEIFVNREDLKEVKDGINPKRNLEL